MTDLNTPPRRRRDDEVSDVELENWLADFREGLTSKSQIEYQFLGDPKSHGKRITKLWRNRLNVETENPEKPKTIEMEHWHGLMKGVEFENAEGEFVHVLMSPEQMEQLGRWLSAYSVHVKHERSKDLRDSGAVLTDWKAPVQR